MFESFVGSGNEVLGEIERLLGPLPKPLQRLAEESGLVANYHAQLDESVLKSHIQDIGVYDQESFEYGNNSDAKEYHLMLESLEEGISNQEATKLADLLRRMLAYTPGIRLFAYEVANHPWFDLNE